MILEGIREQIVAAGIDLLRTGLVTLTWGNISVRDRATGYVAITPSGMEYQKMTPGDIVILGPDGKVVEGSRKPSSETPMHLLIYSKKPRAGAIVHTHSTYATAIGVLGLDVPLVIGELANAVGGPVRTARFAPEGTRDLGTAAVEGMGETDAVILANHGVVVTGPSLKDAFFNAVVVEDAAKVFYLAKALGAPATIPAEEATRLRDKFLSSYGQK